MNRLIFSFFCLTSSLLFGQDRLLPPDLVTAESIWQQQGMHIRVYIISCSLFLIHQENPEIRHFRLLRLLLLLSPFSLFIHDITQPTCRRKGPLSICICASTKPGMMYWFIWCSLVNMNRLYYSLNSLLEEYIIRWSFSTFISSFELRLRFN